MTDNKLAKLTIVSSLGLCVLFYLVGVELRELTPYIFYGLVSIWRYYEERTNIARWFPLLFTAARTLLLPFVYAEDDYIYDLVVTMIFLFADYKLLNAPSFANPKEQLVKLRKRDVVFSFFSLGIALNILGRMLTDTVSFAFWGVVILFIVYANYREMRGQRAK